MTKELLMGNEAMAHAALEAGVGVVAGYPGTPSSEIVETVARQVGRGAAHGVHVEWSTNEKVALELLFGASLAGKRGLFTCKQMGLNVASDALMSLNYVSVRAGLVLIVADDPGPISSQTEQDTRRFAAFAKVPVLDPSSPEQAYAMVKAAFELSERFHTPVIVRPTTRVDHASAFFDVEDETHARAFSSATGTSIATPSDDPDSTQALPSGFSYDPGKWIIFPRRAYEAHGEINDRLADIAHAFASNPAFAQFNPMEEIASTGTDGAPNLGVGLGIVASGISAAYAREALRIVRTHADEAGLRMPAYRFMQIGTPYPFPEEAIADFAHGLVDILVLEELDYVLEDELARFAGRTHAAFNVHGKLTGEARDRGENDVDDIALRIERFLGLAGRLSTFRLRDEARRAELDADEGGSLQVKLTDEAASELPVRPPVLCAGCPHRGSFFAVKRALGDTPAVLCGDIGCYTLGNAKPLEAIDTCLCMGGGITMAQGIAVADPMKKAIAFIGDSTFFASGMTGIANAAYNGHDITVIVLDNSTTAMTGAQPHPGTGTTLMGGYSEPLDIESVLLSCGIEVVLRANPLDLEASTAIVGTALDVEGPSAVIFQSPCAQIVPPDPPALVNRNTCKGCKRCITSIGCPAISFNTQATGPRSGSRGQAVIDQSLCVGCNLCVQVCPFHAILSSEVVAGLTVIEGTTFEASMRGDESPAGGSANRAASEAARRVGSESASRTAGEPASKSAHGRSTEMVAEAAAGFAAAAAAAAAAAEAAGKDAGFDVVVADEDASYNFDLEDDVDFGAGGSGESAGYVSGEVGVGAERSIEGIDSDTDLLDKTLKLEPVVLAENAAVDAAPSDEKPDVGGVSPDEERVEKNAPSLEGEPSVESAGDLVSDSHGEQGFEPIDASDEKLTEEFDTESASEPNDESAGETNDGPADEQDAEPTGELGVELTDEQNADPTGKLVIVPTDEPDVKSADELAKVTDEPFAGADKPLAGVDKPLAGPQEPLAGADKPFTAVDTFGDLVSPDDFPPYPTFENPWELDRADALAPERVKSIESNRASDQAFISALDPEIALIADDTFADNWAVADNELEVVIARNVEDEPGADDASDAERAVAERASAGGESADEPAAAGKSADGSDDEFDNAFENPPSENATFDYAFVGNVAFEYESDPESEVPTADEAKASLVAAGDASADAEPAPAEGASTLEEGASASEENASTPHIPDFGVAADFEEEIEELEAKEAREAEAVQAALEAEEDSDD